jgi:hypothetical protein
VSIYISIIKTEKKKKKKKTGVIKPESPNTTGVFIVHSEEESQKKGAWSHAVGSFQDAHLREKNSKAQTNTGDAFVPYLLSRS